MIRGYCLRLVNRCQERQWLKAGWLQRIGDTLQRRQDVVRRMQWCFVAVYYFLLIVPAVLPQAASRVETFDSLAGLAEIIFWGVWWPGVILSTLLFGQFWCGVFCPDGALTELVSRHGRGGKIPGWVRWSGWPLLAFSVVVAYEHLVDAYQAPRAMLVSLGGASLLALLFGYFYGRGKRVWCRYLCPVSSMFSLLARCAIFHFKVDRNAWDRAAKPLPRSIDCPPLLDVRRLRSNEKCSMCGRCSGHRDAVVLAARRPGAEIVVMESGEIRHSDAFAICFVLIGLCYAAMHWRHGVLTDFLASGSIGLVSLGASGSALLAIVLVALMLGSLTAMLLMVAARGKGQLAMHLAYGLIPLAGLGLFLGALEHSFLLIEQSGIRVVNSLQIVRGLSLAVGAGWSGVLGSRILQHGGAGKLPSRLAYFSLLALLAAAYYFVPAPLLPC